MKTPKDDLQKLTGANGHRCRLRNRFLKNGLDTFADYEVVELLLTMIIPRIDVKPIAKNLIAKFGNLKGILDAPQEDLQQIKGIGQNASAYLNLLRKIIPIYVTQPYKGEKLTLDTVEKLAKFFTPRISNLDYEVLEAAYFNTQLDLIPCGIVRAAEGAINGAVVDIRKIIEPALKNKAASIVIAHNHPSGGESPSKEDVDFTGKLALACKPLNLCLIEHLIITKNGYFSFRRQGFMDILYDTAKEAYPSNAAVGEERKLLK